MKAFKAPGFNKCAEVEGPVGFGFLPRDSGEFCWVKVVGFDDLEVDCVVPKIPRVEGVPIQSEKPIIFSDRPADVRIHRGYIRELVPFLLLNHLQFTVICVDVPQMEFSGVDLLIIAVGRFDQATLSDSLDFLQERGGIRDMLYDMGAVHKVDRLVFEWEGAPIGANSWPVEYAPDGSLVIRVDIPIHKDVSPEYRISAGAEV